MKKTNKILFLTILFALLAFPSFAQNIYIKTNSGYAFPAGTQSKLNISTNMVTSIDQFKSIKYSFGKGINLGGTFGAMFNKNLGLELSIDYLMGSKMLFIEDANTGIVNSSSLHEFRSKMLYFSPSLVIDAGFEKISPYASLGIIIGIPRVIEETNTFYTPLVGSIDQIYQKKETKMDLGFGSHAALGVTFHISEKFSIYGECNSINLSVTPKSSLVTEYTENGRDELASLHVIQKETIYKESLNDDFYNPIPDSEPNVMLKTKEPFSSLGFNIGVKICL